MPIIRDGKSLVGGQRNGKALKAVFFGDKRVWSAAPPFTPHLVSVTTPGPFSVPWPAGATKCDVVLCGSGASSYADGKATTAVAGATTITAPGGTKASSPDGYVGESPGDKTFNDNLYPGGVGGDFYSDGTPPGGGGGSDTFGGFPAGGGAGQWEAQTITTPVANITGTVGAGGSGSGAGNGARGIAHFWFYT